MEPTAGIALVASVSLFNHNYPVISFTGEEGLNKPYLFTVLIHAPDLLNSDLILGKPATITLSCEHRLTYWPSTRVIHGIITKHEIFSPYTTETVRVALTIEPRLKRLHVAGKPRVYVNKSARDIVQSILIQHGYLKDDLLFRDSWASQPMKYPFWVQAQGESDLDFVHRVLAREGISYLWREPDNNRERLLFLDDCHIHPQGRGTLINVEPWETFYQGYVGGFYKLECTRYRATYNVTYRDLDPYDVTKVMEARVGDGTRAVMIWGHGAQSLAHLERAAKQRLEYLMMQSIEYTAVTYNPFWIAGHIVHLDFKPTWVDHKSFLLLNTTHHFQDGIYHNQVHCIPKDTPVRPKPIKRNAGQIAHTAVIHSHDDIPYLDDNGRYSYRLHIHTDEDTPLQTAQRLSPYGGQSAMHFAMGMHFPLHRQSEVLVMYLHNDFNQPIIQNSPSNALNEALIVRDNSWMVCIKTAWGQYLEFCDRLDHHRVTLANADGRNRLDLKAHTDDHQITLACERGSMTLEARDKQSLSSQQSIIANVGGDIDIYAKKEILIGSKRVHLQSDAFAIEAAETIHVEAARDIQLSADDVEIDSEGSLELKATGSVLEIRLPNGDLIIEAEEVVISSPDAVILHTEGASMRFSDDGLEMHADHIYAEANCLEWRAPVYYEATPLPHPVYPNETHPVVVDPVPRYAHGRAKTLQPPVWAQSLYHIGQTAHITIDIQGFDGNESGEFIIVSHPNLTQNTPSEHPDLVALKEAKTVATGTFTLGDSRLYPHPSQHEKTPGTATLHIPYHLEKETRGTESPYYARVRIGDIKGYVYSNPMVVLSHACFRIVSDKAYAYEQLDAVMTLTRALPDPVRADKHSPIVTEARLYENPTVFEHVPLGSQNTIQLKENGQARELLNEDFSLPAGEKYVRIEGDNARAFTMPRLMPPIIFDLREARLCGESVVFDNPTGHERSLLTTDEVDYIKANGNSITVFIHGFNVDYGAFPHHISRLWVEDVSAPLGENLEFANAPVHHASFSASKATIYRDKDFLKRQFPDVEHLDQVDNTALFEGLNGMEDFHQWILYLEHQLNRAAGFDGIHYQPFTRCLFIAWKGAPKNPLNYMEAVENSIRMGPVVGALLHTLGTQLGEAQINVIGHSQGNGVLIHALNYLGKNSLPAISHAFLWQAAIPNDALSTYQGDKNPPVNSRWYCPYAHKGASYFTILHSKNDNVLGPLLHEKNQPPDVVLKDVWLRKPFSELMTAVLLEALAADCLYEIGVWIGKPLSELLHLDTLEAAWKEWSIHHPTYRFQGKQWPCQPTLDAQHIQLARQDLFGLETRRLISERFHNASKKIATILQERYKDDWIGYLLHESAASLLAPILQGFVNQIEGFARNIDTFHIHTLPGEHRVFDIFDNDLYASLINNLLAFSHTVFLCNELKVKPAMGYDGVDDKDQVIHAMVEREQIKVVDTTEWVWSHSDMKIASENILNYVYNDAILQRQGMAFGHYDVGKEHSHAK